MKRLAYTTLLLLLLSAAGGSVCRAQIVYLVNHDTIHISNCRDTAGTIATPLQTTQEAVEMWAVIEAPGQPITLTITGSPYGGDRVRVWQGDTLGNLLQFDNAPNSSPQTVNIPYGRAIICYSKELDWNYPFIRVDWSTPQQAAYCTSGNDAFQIARVTNYTADIVWPSNGAAARVILGTDTSIHYGDTIHLTGLAANQWYTATVCAVTEQDYPCCYTTLNFLTDLTPVVGCPDFTNLHAEYTRCTYGTFSAPYLNIGVMDTSSNIFFNRHMVCTDTSERDPRTNNQLRTVYPGSSGTVRLGNPRTGAEAEAITYALHVDTTYYALLLLHYAVVLQNPDHSLLQQPRFRLEILDGDDHVIDPTCGTADFHASSSLGWNSYYGILWKDWTTVGFDLTPYHGQTVHVRFTTYDCSQGGHFGYAYFNAECRLKSATAEYCASADSNTITAPDGFHYLWYFDDPTDTVSTQQTVHFSNTDALLQCRLISTENPNCWVTLNTYAGYRWPLAVIDTIGTESLGCDGHLVTFTNLSTITNENGVTVGGMCESAMWYFGDGYMSHNYSTQHVYRDSGDYTVRVIVGIAGNQCRDTTEMTIHIPDFYIPAVKDTFACDSLVIDGRTYTADTIGPQYRVNHPDGCDTLYTLNIHILHSPQTLLAADTFCYRDTYSWRGQTVGYGNDTITQTARHLLADTLVAANGCDSLVLLPLVQLAPPRILFDAEPDCSSRSYALTARTDLPSLRWSSNPPDPLIAGHEGDNPLRVAPPVHTTYRLMADLTDSFACPTFDSVGLSPVAAPTALLSVHPNALTHDNTLLVAHDISHFNGNRRWFLLPHPDNDTVFPAETSATLHYNTSGLDFDSITVILAIGDNYNCTDTARHTVPFIHVLLWAPNTFTPGADNNNRFQVVTTGLTLAELSIYNRQGLLVHRTTDAACSWDGTHNGRPCPQGAYVWLLRYQAADYPGTWRTASGTVTLLR